MPPAEATSTALSVAFAGSFARARWTSSIPSGPTVAPGAVRSLPSCPSHLTSAPEPAALRFGSAFPPAKYATDSPPSGYLTCSSNSRPFSRM